MDKVLVTGGAGFVGSNLIKRLIQSGKTVDCIDNFKVGKEVVDGCKYYVADVNDISFLKNEYKTVYHLAALSRIQPSFTTPVETFINNTEGVLSVLEWLRGSNTKLIYSGSSSKHHNPYQSPYATTKYLGEELCRMYKLTYGVNVDIVRFYNVYGPGELVDSEWAALIGIWRRQIRDGLPLTIVGDGEQRRDFTYIDDIVDGLMRVSNVSTPNMNEWELGTGVNYSINEVFRLFKDKFPHITANYIEDQKGNYRETIRETDGALTQLGWNPTDKLKEYIESL